MTVMGLQVTDHDYGVDTVELEILLRNCDKNSSSSIFKTLQIIRTTIDRVLAIPVDVRNIFTRLINDSTTKLDQIHQIQDVQSVNGTITSQRINDNLTIINTMVWSWVLSIIKSPLPKAHNTHENDYDQLILDDAANIIAALSGRTASGLMLKTWQFVHCSLQINEMSFAECDLGYQTWGAGVLLAYLLDLGTIDVATTGQQTILELGSGTGIGGLALCKQLCTIPGRTATIVMTDYHCILLTNLDHNIRANNLSVSASLRYDVSSKTYKFNDIPPVCSLSLHIATAELDWRWLESTSDTNTNHTGWFSQTKHISDDDESVCNHVQRLLTTLNTFDVIIAADIIYDTEKAHQVPYTIALLLRRPSTSTNNSSTNPCCWIVLPLRPCYDADIILFEKQMNRWFECILMQNYLANYTTTDINRYRLYKYQWHSSPLKD